jgi:hypothetical protein
MNTSALAKPRRRWLRFSMWVLFLLLVGTAVSLGWMINKARQQGIAVAALKKLGCSVGCDMGDERPPTILERLRKLLGEDEFRNVTMVNGYKSQMTDAGMAHLQELTQLTGLNLDGTQVADAGLVVSRSADSA